jgi:predicted nucleic acid-binding protein
VSATSRTPLILDTGVLIAVARGDADVIGLVQGYDARDQPIIIPALALAGASFDVRSEEADDLLAGLELLDAVTIAPLSGAEQATRLAHVAARTGLDPWDARVAAIADVAVCPILTLDASKWRDPSSALDDPLHVIEIIDPGDQEPGP